jgi:GGDEF domain-containing protein
VEEVPPPVTLAPALELTPPEERISVPAVTPLAASDGDSNGGNVVRIRVLRTPASGASEETPAATAAPASPAPTKPDEPAPLAPYLAPATSPIAPLAPAAISEPLRLSPAATPSLPQLALSVDTPTVSPKAPEPAPAPLALPAGFTDRATLDFLKRDPAPFTGLVVSIGINDYARLAESQGKNTADDLVRNVNQLVNSLIASPNGAQSHFACRTADDEFLVIYPNETGQAAQRRLNALSERLWDFQLRSLGTFSVVFSWGATEAVSENFAEAVSAASERMLETRQNRKTISMGQPMKKVVNG